MKKNYILFCDTSTEKRRLMIADNNRIISFIEDNSKTQHSYKILHLIDFILKHNNLTLKDIDYYSVTVGPGSFTGIRIAIATLKGFCYTLNKNILGLNNLDVYLNSVKHIFNNCNDISALMYAGKNLFYITDYNIKNNNVNKIKFNYLVSIKNLLNNKEYQKKKFVSDSKTINKLKDCKNRIFNIDDFNFYNTVYKMILSGINNNETTDLFKLNPLYIKKSDAEFKKDNN
jgi:tRNA threonylcarbamoyladenosine biosynthesis protein TsaB